MLKKIIGAAVGGALGFVYYQLVGCSTGTCPITSNPVNTIIYGAVMGLLISWLISDTLSEIRAYKKKHSKPDEDSVLNREDERC